jgi:hypothetical protein
MLTILATLWPYFVTRFLSSLQSSHVPTSGQGHPYRYLSRDEKAFKSLQLSGTVMYVGWWTVSAIMHLPHSQQLHGSNQILSNGSRNVELWNGLFKFTSLLFDYTAPADVCVCVCRGGGGLLVRAYEAVTIEIILPRILFSRKLFSQFHEKVCIMHCDLDFTERDLKLKI